MPSYRKQLIEVAFPRTAINEAPTRTLRTARRRGPNAPMGTPGGKVAQVRMRQ